MLRPSAQRTFGALLVLAATAALFVGVGAALKTPAFARVVHEVRSGLQGEGAGDLWCAVSEIDGVCPGDPVYRYDDEQGTQPIAHVVRVSSPSEPPRVCVRFAYGEGWPGPARLHVLAPARRLGEAVAKAMPPEVLADVGEQLRLRFLSLWREALAPDLKQRLPAFLARIDPEQDEATRELLEGLSHTLLLRMDPLLADLTRTIRKALDDELGFLDRMGLLWKVATGDEKGLEKKVLPVAREAAERWWSEHRAQVLEQVGLTVRAHSDELAGWAGGRLLDAARDELLDPLLVAHRKRIESDAEALLREAVDAFVRAPDGGLRVRFAAVVRDTLLGKHTALLLLEPVGPMEPR